MKARGQGGPRHGSGAKSIWWHVVIQLHQRVLAHEGVPRERTDVAEPLDRLTVRRLERGPRPHLERLVHRGEHRDRIRGTVTVGRAWAASSM
jgi:hypothetical protein